VTRKYSYNCVVFLCSSVLILVLIEIYYRIFDPFPYFCKNEINAIEHGNLLEYDSLVGWRGIPNKQIFFTTQNSRIIIKNNKYGFRDIEHSYLPNLKPSIIFLGDSFTWGYEVEFNHMFVNLLRKQLPFYEIYNISHRGFGTDQELIVFKNIEIKNPLKWVILMFCENDVDDNNSNFRYKKYKPKFKIINGYLTLSGVPVPKQDDWSDTLSYHIESSSIRGYLKKILLSSYLVHDLYFRYNNFILHNRKKPFINKTSNNLTITIKIIDALKSEVEKKGARLIIVLIPSKYEIENFKNYVPYQIEIIKICNELNIQYLDLAPYFKRKFLRTYYRIGMHWNSRGNQVAANALLKYLCTIE